MGTNKVSLAMLTPKVLFAIILARDHWNAVTNARQYAAVHAKKSNVRSCAKPSAQEVTHAKSYATLVVRVMLAW